MGLKKAVMHWSGGKDSALALHRLLRQKEYEVSGLLTTVNQALERVSMHGVRLELLQQQAESLRLPLHSVRLPETVSMAEYSRVMHQALEEECRVGVEYSVFGDIFLADLKAYREQELAQVPMQGLFPLWQANPAELLREFIDSGFQAVVVCINARVLDKTFVGRRLDENFLADLPAGVDVCGENGEYHSFVFDGPIFHQPVAFTLGEVVYRSHSGAESSQGPGWDTGFWYQDLLPSAQGSFDSLFTP